MSNQKNPEIGSLEFFTMGNLAAAGLYLGEFQKLGAEPIWLPISGFFIFA